MPTDSPETNVLGSWFRGKKREVPESAASATTFALGVVPGVEAAMADAELFELLRATGFKGRAWDRFAQEAARYAVSVLSAWMSSGQISQEIRAKGIPMVFDTGELQRLATDPDLRAEFANMAVARSLHKFREDGRVGKGWRADGGTNLRSWILGKSVLAVVDELKKDRRRRVRELKDLLAAARVERLRLDMEATSDPLLDRTCSSEFVLSHLHDLPNQRDRNIVWGKAAGHSNAEIAEMFGERSAKAVANRWTNLRGNYEWVRRLNGRES
ncbi:hypothetical protein OHB26_39550 (plasmid) [Nocardia sp. NBC_01503]|uniref:hypothetical protein n=1 Tax=Nocardia sp. NBC_01503 TaxID=2975997 RepID=UPI002E7C1170|nr:hypothetical protein [Nocardia sp. NBC_01503]WTL36673.1 hypothetical protein OHB26_39025 [Nocardia sp. NBC_01503]WTL36774.1 hypothetical protein OHB26_39550 [Nocardia sp. NBC_01503]